VEDIPWPTRQALTTSDKATTISIVRRCAAVVEGPAAVLAKAIPSTPVDTQGAPCPGAYYCIAPGPDPEVPYGTNPYVPYGPDPVTRGNQAF